MKAFNNDIKIKEKFVNRMKLTTEEVVGDFLLSKGFAVSINKSINSNGIDLVAIKNSNHFLIEVKKANKSNRAISVSSLNKSGIRSDYIAIVTPKNNIIFQTIEDHLKLISKKGTRGVTKLVNLYDEF